jgi:hypothetical protein
MKPPTRVFRLAVREEGNYINAYLASPESMDDAVHVASLRVTVARQYPEVFDPFVEFIKELARVMGEGVYGNVAGIEIEEAPEHERSGRA